MSLSFLRPVALPRPATIRQFFKISNARSYSTLLTSEAPVSTTESTPSPLAGPAAPSKPYRVLLSPSNHYPIYQISKRGGNKHETKVKNIQGDIQALRNDLQELLSEPGKEKATVLLNSVTGQLVVKVRC
jgi:large subunit ribosomal protein L49